MKKKAIVAAMIVAGIALMTATVAEAAYHCTGNCSGRGGGYKHCHCVWKPF